jgi:branched-chain amino acid transport system substrate-binding protein
MVQEQINKAGGINGHPLELKIMDSQTDPSKAVTALQSLLRDPEILAVAGGSSSPDNFAMIPIIEKEGLTLMSCGGSIKISDPVKKWVFQVPATDRIAMQSILKYLKSKNITKVAMIHSTGGWGTSGAEQLKEQAPNFGITVLSYESFGDKDVDMTPQLTRMRDLNPQAIISWTATAAGSIISKNLKQLGIKALHVHDHGFGNLKFVKIAGDAANGGVLPMGKIVVADQIDAKDPQKKALSDFREQYEKQWNETIPAFAAHTFDGLMILKKALETAGADRAKIRDAVENMKNFIGINGVFNFSPKDHNGLDESAMVMIRIANQNWQVIKE